MKTFKAVKSTIAGKAGQKRFQGWDKVKITSDSGIEKEAIAPVIISATRRSDIPAWHSDWFMKRLRRGHLISTHFRRQYVSFAKTRVIVFWTKNPEPMFKYLDEIDQRGIGYYFQYTLNDYVNDNLEPNLPSLQKRIEYFRTLSEKIGKERIIWRFDPLIQTNLISKDNILDKVHGVMTQLKGDTEKLVISFCDYYKKVVRKLNGAGVKYRVFSDYDKNYIAERLGKMGEEFGIEVATCAEKNDFSQHGITRNKCIDDALMRRLFGQDNELISFLDIIDGQKHNGQRKLCGCIPSFDVGNYNTCKNGCVYCYANDSQNAVVKNFNRLSFNGETLLIST